MHVVSGEKHGYFSFCEGGNYRDEYKHSWTVSGDEDLLNLTIIDQRIENRDYPDALARLSSSLRSHKGNYIVVTAKPGYEFQDKASPRHTRIVDLKSWILRLLTEK